MSRGKQWGILLMVIGLLFMTGCSVGKPSGVLRDISTTTGVDVSAGEVITAEDSHGGFHGDGTTVIEVQYKGTALAEQIEEHGDWNVLPLTENLTALVYGVHTEETSVGPMVHDGTGTPILSKVQNGYWFFYDRHSQSTNPKDDSGVLGRASYNFTIAIYDTVNQTLYYIEFDT